MAVQSTLINLAGNRGQTKRNVEGAVTRRAYIDASTNNLTSGDFYRLFKYDANTLIQKAHIITETVEGAADTIDVTDDESGTTTLCSNHDLNTDNAITNYSTGLFKNTAGYISLKPDAAIATAKFWVVVVLIPLNIWD
jgi:hypothetical protein